MADLLPVPVVELLEQGGFVMPWLILSAFAVWYAIGMRWVTLRRTREQLSALARGPRSLSNPHAFEVQLERCRAQLNAYKSLIQTIAMAAPLAGLLGTVTGMIETFRGLGESALFSQTGGVAGGISEALLTTQMGLAVAIPAIVVGRILDRKESTYSDEVDAKLAIARQEVVQCVAA